MSWRDQYQKGSFRGAPFRTERDERSGGRRVVTHEFPARDEPLTEDLGARAKTFTLDCHVIGSDFIARRDALIDALEASGPGLLVHPQYGRMLVVVYDYSASTSTEEGGMCRFAITFGESGQAVSSPARGSVGDDSARIADQAEEAAPEELAKAFSIAQAAAFVEASAEDLVHGIGQVSRIAASMRGGIGPALRAFEAGLDFLPANIGGLLRAPLSLGSAISGLVLAVASLPGGGRRTRLASLELMLDWEPPAQAFPVATPQRAIEAANRAALLQAFRVVVGAELVRAAASIDYPSYDDAIATRDATTARLDARALQAADRGDDTGAAWFDALRRALARDIAVRGATLARVYGLSLQDSEPALVVAHRLYGGDPVQRTAPRVGIEARGAAIVARNDLAHPGFLPAGTELELLTATAEGTAA
ncbi:DNA circularization N-terminal domain-containing protein [Citromicrobium bathyomarinum]|uniref:DNA circularization protein n=1 Tax=Citromicrobium bathyomarinum TaxID=72174 RepID=UPI003159D4AA